MRAGENGLKAAKGDCRRILEHALDALSLRPDHELRDRRPRNRGNARAGSRWSTKFERRLAEIAGITPKRSAAGRSKSKRPKFSCRTVFLSDIHLGTPDSKADEVVEFLKHINCRKLVLNGDIIDGWALKRGGQWTSRHSRVIRKVHQDDRAGRHRGDLSARKSR